MSIIKKAMSIFTAAIITVTALVSMTVSASAAEEVKLDVTVMDAHSATATISNTEIPTDLRMDYITDSERLDYCVFAWEVRFGDYRVSLNITQRYILNYCEQTGESTMPLNKKAACIMEKIAEHSYRSIEGIDVSYTTTKNSITFDFDVPNDCDLTKVTEYELYTINPDGDYYKVFAAENENVISTSDEKGGKLSDMKIAAVADQNYTGKKLTPKLVITDGDYTLVNGTDYTVTYKNNKSIGKATITITGKGDYSGKVTKTFKIVPKTVTISSIKADGNKAVLKWKKNSTADSYKIYYSTSKNGTYKLLKTLKGVNTTSYTTKALEEGKTYYFKIKACKTVNSKVYTSAYSKVKSITFETANEEASKGFVGVFRGEGYTIVFAQDVEATEYFNGDIKIAIDMGSDVFFPRTPKIVNNAKITDFTSRGDEVVVEFDFKLDGDTLYYHRLIHANNYEENITLQRTDESAIDAYNELLQ